MSKRALLVAVVTAAVVAAPGLPVAAEPPSRTTVLAADGVTTVDGRRTVTHPLAPLFGSERDTLAVLKATTERLLGSAGPTAAGARGAAREGQATGSDEGTADAATEIHVSGAKAGDLNGDARTDALLTVSDSPDELRAVAGDSGAILWTQRPGDVYAYGLGVDLTGNGTDDVIRITLNNFESVEGEFDCAAGHCFSDYSESFEETVAVLEGSTGAIAWERTWKGSYSEQFATTEGTLDDRVDYEIKRDAVVALRGPDVTGDALPDLVFNHVVSDVQGSYTETNAGAVFKDDAERTLRSSTDATIVSGATGQTVLRRESLLGPAVSYLAPAGDAVGDGSGDLLWERSASPDRTSSCIVVLYELAHCTDEPEGSAYDLEMIDGATLQAAWSSSVPVPVGGYVIAFAVEDDLSGDGKDDVLRYVARPESETRSGGNIFLGGSYTWGRFWHEYDPSLLSGTDGRVLWARDDGASPLAYSESQDGVDVLLADIDDDDVTAVVRFERVRGATGEVLSTHTREFPMTPQPSEPSEHIWSYLSAWTPGDVDGDGRYDLAAELSEEHQDADDPGFVRTSLGGTFAVDAGSNGAAIYSQEFSDDRWFDDPGDLNGDGRDDLLQITTVGEDEDAVDSVTALAPADGQTLWSHSAAGVQIWHRVGGDQDGQPGVELLEHRRSRSNSGGTFLRSISGATGATRWQVTE